MAKNKQNVTDRVKVGFNLSREHQVYLAVMVAKKLADGEEKTNKSCIIEEAIELLYEKTIGK